MVAAASAKSPALALFALVFIQALSLHLNAIYIYCTKFLFKYYMNYYCDVSTVVLST